MILYLFILIAISILNFFSWRIKALRPVILLTSFLALILVSGLRDVSVGIDTKNYLAFFNRIIQDGLSVQDFHISKLFVPSGFEMGFTIYTYLVSLITNDFTVYLLVTSALIYIPIYLFIKRYSPDYYLSTVIYYCLFFFGSMSLLRQSMAMSILTLGTKYIVSRNPIKFLAIVLLAASFHVSALVGLILYPIYNKSLSRFTALVTLIGAALIFLAMGIFVKFAATLNYRYEFYLDRIDSFSVASMLSCFLYLFILILLLVLHKKNPDIRKSSINQGFLIITAFTALIVMGLSIKVNSLDRLSLVFVIYTLISIPIFISSRKITFRPVYLKLFLICLFVSYSTVILLIRPEWYGVTDYKVNINLLRSQ